MPSREYHEALWEAVPAGAEPSAFALRRDFLLANVRAGERVLDLGCGEGRFASELKRAGAEVVAADVAEEPLRRARAALPELDARLIDGEGTWALPDASFDVVWAGEVIEHVADTAGWLSEARRVLRSGGLLLLSTPAHGLRERLRLALAPGAFAAHFEPRADHLRFYTRSSLIATVHDFGFDELDARHAAARGHGQRLILARAVRSRY